MNRITSRAALISGCLLLGSGPKFSWPMQALQNVIGMAKREPASSAGDSGFAAFDLIWHVMTNVDPMLLSTPAS